VAVADHLLRGAFWPEFLFGIPSPDLARAIEHGGWVVFEDIFLFLSIRQSLGEMRSVAAQQANLESLNSAIESTVVLRTAELSASEEKFRQLSAAAPIGIFQTDSSGCCLLQRLRCPSSRSLLRKQPANRNHGILPGADPWKRVDGSTSP
jgi:hypothetical protein